MYTTQLTRTGVAVLLNGKEVTRLRSQQEADTYIAQHQEMDRMVAQLLG